MNYQRSTVQSLLRRLRAYTGYVVCGCYGLAEDEKCKLQKNCARGDYWRALTALKRLVTK